MSALVEFLRARLDEREELARACGGVPWVDDVPGMVHVDPKTIRAAKWALGHLGYVAGTDQGVLGDAYRAHVAANDPAYVLADVEAKRRIVELHSEIFAGNGVCRADELGWPCETLQLLALPFADHPDYDPSWRPAEVTA